MHKDQVIKVIKSAFNDVSRPTHTKLFVMGWDRYEELNHAYEHLVVEDWRLLSFETIRTHRHATQGFNPEWRVFLLPAFLTHTLGDLEKVDILIDNLLLCLTHPIMRFEFDTDDEKDFADFVGFLTPEQCDAFATYMRFFVSMNPDRAIYNDNNIIQAIQYWDRKAGHLDMD